MKKTKVRTESCNHSFGPVHLNRSRVELGFLSVRESGGIWRAEPRQCGVKLVLNLCDVLEHAQRGGGWRRRRD